VSTFPCFSHVESCRGGLATEDRGAAEVMRGYDLLETTFLLCARVLRPSLIVWSHTATVWREQARSVLLDARLLEQRS
jgi:hypothetical protein